MRRKYEEILRLVSGLGCGIHIYLYEKITQERLEDIIMITYLHTKYKKLLNSKSNEFEFSLAFHTHNRMMLCDSEMLDRAYTRIYTRNFKKFSFYLFKILLIY